MLALGACASVDPSLTPVEQGRRLYDTYCTECHGPRAVGTNDGPGLIGPEYLPDSMSDTDILVATTEGIEPGEIQREPGETQYDGMAAIPAVNHSEVARITLYIRQLQGIEPPDTSAP
jgi:mono/diheme cytochrome c family protein